MLLGQVEKCAVCGGVVSKPYVGMKEWAISGYMCGKCYSTKLNEHYPGEHTRVR